MSPAEGTAPTRPTGYGASFWLVWTASAVSGVGDGVRFVVLPILAAKVTRDPLLVASVTVAGQLPWVVVGPVTGVLTDRWDRQRLLWRVAVFQAVVMSVFALAVLTGAANVTILAVGAFVLVASETLSMNVSAAILPDLVGEDRLDSANSRLQGAQFITSDIIGLSVGAVLFGLAQALPFAFDAVSFALAALLLVKVRLSRTPADAETPRVTVASVRRDMAEGMRWLLRHRLLRTMCGLVALSNFAVVGVMAVAVLYAYQVLHVGSTAYGLLMTIVAMGGVVGLTAAPWLSRRLGTGRCLRLTFLMSPVPFLVTGLTSQPIVAAASFFVVGASISLSNVVGISLRQRLVPSEMFGRVNSFYRLLALGLGPFGGAFAGLLSHALGVRAPFLVGAGLLTVTVVLALPGLSDRAVEAAVQRDDTGPRAEDGGAVVSEPHHPE